MGAGILFVLAFGARAIFENLYSSRDAWKARGGKSLSEKWIAGIVTWGVSIPFAPGILLLVYAHRPGTRAMLVVCCAGIVTRDGVVFLAEKLRMSNRVHSTDLK